MINPDGTIYFNQNIGKWPNVEEIFSDLEAIAKNFPTLDFKGSVFNNNYNNDDMIHVFSFKVKKGKVSLHSEMLVEKDIESFEKTINKFIASSDGFGGYYRHEWGLPADFYAEMANRIHKIIDNEIESFFEGYECRVYT